MDNGFLFTWGGNYEGQLGRDVGGVKATTPGIVARLTSEKIVGVGVGCVHCLALTEKVFFCSFFLNYLLTYLHTHTHIYTHNHIHKHHTTHS